MTSPARDLSIGLAFGLAAALAWSAQAVVARSGTLAGYTPLDLAALRYIAAGLVLAPFAWRWRGVLAGIGFWRLLALAVTGGAGNALLFGWGVVHAPASHGGTIAPITAAVMGALLGIPLLREWPTRGRVIAIAVIAGGVLLIGWDGIGGAHPGAWRGDLILVAAGTSWAAFTLLLRRWRVPALAGNAAVCGISALLVVPPWLVLGAAEVAAQPWKMTALQMVAQGLLASALATTLYARAVELLGGTRTACLTTLVPVMALLLSVIVLGEPLGAAKLAGVTLAVGGMLAAVLFTGRRR
ncbi:DMT family transporter [Falsiroseomonas oryziterrae]|uniref:DMT family transporter n=1 Tax=Falsiroseomonas oryziterrae TaxID=2911368 RepID=UPI001F3C7E85|nr:DMT family transporter [Roseomonas sp. NPKOSM-4]